MLPYLFIFCLLLILIRIYDIENISKNKWLLFWIICFIFIILSGLRYKIGTDTIRYMQSFKDYPDFWKFNWINDVYRFKETELTRERYKELWIFYVILNKGLYNNYFFLQFTIAVIFNIAIFKVIKKNSKKIFITILLFYTNFNFLELEFELMRQSLSIAFFLLISIDAFVDKKWAKYYIGAFVASLIHPGAYITFILPIFRYYKLDLRKTLLFIILPSLIISIFGKVFLGSLFNSLSLESSYATKYINSGLQTFRNTNYVLLTILRPTALLLLLLISWRTIKNNVFTPLFILAIVLYYFSIIFLDSYRLVDYFLILVFISVTPFLYQSITNIKKVCQIIFLLVLLNSPTLFSFYRSEEAFSRFFPYQNIIYNEQTPLQKELTKFN